MVGAGVSMVRITTLGKRWAAGEGGEGKKQQGEKEEDEASAPARALTPWPPLPPPLPPRLPHWERGTGTLGAVSTRTCLAGLPSPGEGGGGGGTGEGPGRGPGPSTARNFAKLTGADEIRPEKAPGPTPQTEVQAAARERRAAAVGKGTETAEDSKFLEGPHSRASEFRRLLRIGADFHPAASAACTSWAPASPSSARRASGGPPLLCPRPRDRAAARPRRLHHADRRRPLRHHGGGQPRRPRRRRAVDRLQHHPPPGAEAQSLPRAAGWSSATSSSAK